MSQMDCTDNGMNPSENHKVVYYSSNDIEEQIDPPPSNLITKFASIEEWLNVICDEKKPDLFIATYKIGLLESPQEIIIYLVGINSHSEGDTTQIRIDFEPTAMYFSLPKNEYKNLNRDQLLNTLTVQLKSFSNTENFKSSFLSNANALKFETNGLTIWTK